MTDQHQGAARSPVSIRMGLQIPSFTYPGVPDAELFERVATDRHDRRGAAASTRCYVMDHFYQLPLLGRPDEPMMECYTLLSALAAKTRTVRLGAMVGGVTYRNPAFLAKVVTTLDVVSGGRAIWAIGAAWNQQEHEALRLRVRHLHRAVREARGGAPDRQEHVRERHHHLRAGSWFTGEARPATCRSRSRRAVRRS